MSRLSDTPPQPDSYQSGDMVWAIPSESPADDQSAFVARVAIKLGADAYLIRFVDDQMPAHWQRRWVYAYEELELLIQ